MSNRVGKSGARSLRIVAGMRLERNIVIFYPRPLRSDFTRMLTDKENEFHRALLHVGVHLVL